MMTTFKLKDFVTFFETTNCAHDLYAMRIFSFIHTCHTFTGVTDEEFIILFGLGRLLVTLVTHVSEPPAFLFNDLGFSVPFFMH